MVVFSSAGMMNIDFTTVRLGRRFHQPLQRVHIPAVIARLVNWCFRDESRMCQPRIIQQPAEWLNSNRALSDVLMAVQLRAPRGFGIIAMPDPNVLQTNCAVELSQCFAKTLL
jgi:hypothetical protein